MGGQPVEESGELDFIHLRKDRNSLADISDEFIKGVLILCLIGDSLVDI